MVEQALGFDEETSGEVECTFTEEGPLGIGFLPYTDEDGKHHAVVHSINEGTLGDLEPHLVPGQVLLEINGENVDGSVVDIAAKITEAGRLLTLKLEPGSLDLKLAAFNLDYKTDVRELNAANKSVDAKKAKKAKAKKDKDKAKKDKDNEKKLAKGQKIKAEMGAEISVE